MKTERLGCYQGVKAEEGKQASLLRVKPCSHKYQLYDLEQFTSNPTPQPSHLLNPHLISLT